MLIDELLEKTTASYEILVWINVDDPAFEHFLADRRDSGASLRIVGRTPNNIGMAAHPILFSAAKFEMVVQIDDDVVCISPLIAERAQEIFDKFPQVGMITADCWQDEYTTGARPTMQNYREFSREFGLYDGPIDGWFAIYRRSSLVACANLNPSRYCPLGCIVKSRLRALGQSGLLCTQTKVFHVIGPAYASYFGMLELEVEKYSALGRKDIVNWYRDHSARLPSQEELARRISNIRARLACASERSSEPVALSCIPSNTALGWSLDATIPSS
jgi:hypothetical protein